VRIVLCRKMLKRVKLREGRGKSKCESKPGTWGKKKEKRGAKGPLILSATRKIKSQEPRRT